MLRNCGEARDQLNDMNPANLYFIAVGRFPFQINDHLTVVVLAPVPDLVSVGVLLDGEALKMFEEPPSDLVACRPRSGPPGPMMVSKWGARRHDYVRRGLSNLSPLTPRNVEM